MRKAGKVKLIGITGYPLEQFRYVLERTQVKIDIVLSYCRSTLIDASLDGYIPYLESKGVGLINAAATSMGLLTHAGPPVWHPASEEVKNACARARKLCEERGVDITRLAIRSSIENHNLPTTLVSAAKLEYIKANLENAGKPLTSPEKQVLDLLRSDVFASLGAAHWEGVEVGRYWEALGRKLQMDRLYGTSA